MYNLLLNAFLLITQGPTQPASDIHCLAETIYHEARGEPSEGKAGVVRVVLNRAKTPVRYWPKNICDVVYQPGQFVWTADLPRHKLHRHHEWKTWQRAQVKATVFFWMDQMGIPFTPVEIRKSTFFSRDGFTNPKLEYQDTVGNHQFFALASR